MKNKKSFISFVILLFIFSALTVGCSKESTNLKSENEILKRENAQLKDKVYQLGKTISEIKLNQENITLNPLMIDYVEVNDKVRFIEKENYILALPQSGSSILRPVGTNTLATVYEKSLVDNESWLFVRIPTYDSSANNRGWIRESDTTAYTKDKIKLVQSDVDIKAGSEVYETYEFKDIKTITPIKLTAIDGGRLEEKKDGYCRISLAGGRDMWVKESSVIYPEVK
jgi:hypothetical protein